MVVEIVINQCCTVRETRDQKTYLVDQNEDAI